MKNENTRKARIGSLGCTAPPLLYPISHSKSLMWRSVFKQLMHSSKFNKLHYFTNLLKLSQVDNKPLMTEHYKLCRKGFSFRVNSSSLICSLPIAVAVDTIFGNPSISLLAMKSVIASCCGVLSVDQSCLKNVTMIKKTLIFSF